MTREWFIEQLRQSLQIKCSQNVELFSRDLVYDFAYLDFRVSNTRISGAKWNYAVEFLVHYLLDKEQRKEIFSCPYDLGNRVTLESNQTKQKQIEIALENYALYAHENENISLNNIGDIIKRLKLIIKEITGRQYREFTGFCENSQDVALNSSVATKVLFTVFRFRRKWPKFFMRYAKPANGKPSLELRDAHALEGFDEVPKIGVMLHADLKIALSFGMLPEELSTILPVMEQISVRFEASSAPSSGYIMLHTTNRHLRPSTLPTRQESEELLPSGPRTLPERLDKSLYTSLVLREAENRVVAKAIINKFLDSPASQIPSIEASDEDLMRLAVSKRSQDKAEFISTLSIITSTTISEKQFDEAHALQNCLRFIIKSPFEDSSVNLLEYLASIITCIKYGPEPITISAYWHGKLTSSNSPEYFLKKVAGHNDLKGIPELYQEYWFRRYHLISCTLMKCRDLWDEFNEVEQLEFGLIKNVLNTHELTSACGIIKSYFDKFPKTPY